MDRKALDQALLAAHSRQDKTALVRLYMRAAEDREQADDTDAACFFLTQAFVFALEAGAAEADALDQMLAAHGRV